MIGVRGCVFYGVGLLMHPAASCHSHTKEVTVSPVHVRENESVGHLCCVQHSRRVEHVAQNIDVIKFNLFYFLG